MRTDEEEDIFEHYTVFKSESTLWGLCQGDVTNFRVRTGRKGPEAVDVLAVKRPVTVENDDR